MQGAFARFKRVARLTPGLLGVAIALAGSPARAQLVEGKPLSPERVEQWVSQKAKNAAKWADVDSGKPFVMIGENHLMEGHWDYFAERIPELKRAGITHVFFEEDSRFQPVLDKHFQNPKKSLEPIKGSQFYRDEEKLIEKLHRAGIKVVFPDETRGLRAWMERSTHRRHVPVDIGKGANYIVVLQEHIPQPDDAYWDWYTTYGRNKAWADSIVKTLDEKKGNRVLMISGAGHTSRREDVPYLVNKALNKDVTQSIILTGLFGAPWTDFEFPLWKVAKPDRPRYIPLEPTQNYGLHWDGILDLPPSKGILGSLFKQVSGEEKKDLANELYFNMKDNNPEKKYAVPPRMGN